MFRVSFSHLHQSGWRVDVLEAELVGDLLVHAPSLDQFRLALQGLTELLLEHVLHRY